MAKSYPRRFGKYVLVAPLAQGGMGELHLAFSGRAELKKLCVIKTILGHLADDEFITRFVDEAKVVVKLSHGNLIPVLEAGQVDGQFFLAMEYIDGKDLRDVWYRLQEEEKRFPLDVALYIAREICRGLSYVHSYSDLHLVHRDVSPPNVLLSYTGEVRLTDFGVATSTIKLQKTAPGILLGKLSYMSPEQARNEAVDARADIYSLGVILWELVTGERLLPPEGDLSERYQLAIKPEFRPPSAINPDMPEELDLISRRTLAREREDRYPDAEHLRRDLSHLLGKLSPAIDGSTVQALLREIYGREREQEESSLLELVDSMAHQVQELVTGAETGGQQKATWSRPSEETADLELLDVEGSYDDDFGELTPPYLQKGILLANRYQIEELIGEGGMGRVYLATHAEIGKKVAVKVLHPSYSRMPDLVSRFRREARAASKIGHPHIVEVYDSGKTHDGSIYFVMEYLTGIDLADVLSGEGRLGIERTIRIGIQVCEAVAAAHEEGINHRDLKPENIFLTTREGTPDFVKVLDFGLAQTTALEDSHQGRRERLTNPGMAMGTPEYMAPEQAAGKPTDHRVDVYAVGTLLYEMLLGDPPHVGDNIMEVFNRKAVDPIIPPSKNRPDIPPELERVVLWALEDDPGDRPQTMSQMAYELTKLARGRAGAVASLLGIPDVSGNASGPLLAVQSGEEYTSEDLTAHLLPSQRPFVPLWVWVLSGAMVIAAVTVVVGVVVPADPAAERDLVQDMAHISPSAAADAALRVSLSPLRDTTAAHVLDGGPPIDQGETVAAAGPDAAVEEVKPHPPVAGRPSYLYLGRRHLLAGRFNEARQAFRMAMRRRRHRGRAKLGLAEVEFQLGRFKIAQQYAEEAATQGGSWRARLVLANIHYRLRNYKRAIQLYKVVLSKRPNHPEARRNMDAAQHRLNQ